MCKKTVVVVSRNSNFPKEELKFQREKRTQIENLLGSGFASINFKYPTDQFSKKAFHKKDLIAIILIDLKEDHKKVESAVRKLYPNATIFSSIDEMKTTFAKSA